jgi:hypothetical protein
MVFAPVNCSKLLTAAVQRQNGAVKFERISGQLYDLCGPETGNIYE